MARLASLSAIGNLFATFTTTTAATAGFRSGVLPLRPDLQDAMLRVDPQQFFRPTTSGAGHFKDLPGIFLDIDDQVDWDEVAYILRRAYRMIAPKMLIARIDRD